MRVVPVVLERAIAAGLLLIPLAAALFLLGLEGDAGLVYVAIVLACAALYGGVGWLVGNRRRHAAEHAAATPAPDDARLEPLARTAVRGLPLLGAAVLLCLLLAQFDALVGGLVFAGGSGVLAALGALDHVRWERRAPGRLVRAPDGGLRRF